MARRRRAECSRHTRPHLRALGPPRMQPAPSAWPRSSRPRRWSRLARHSRAPRRGRRAAPPLVVAA
eukprot:635332-Alexandrium_andersonii.AAC.1